MPAKQFVSQHKLKISLLFLFMIALIVINNVHNRKNLTEMDHSVASMYQDRLLASTYLFDLSSQLHEGDINGLKKTIDQYEKTYLIPQEKIKWQEFKSSMVAVTHAQPGKADKSAAMKAAQENLKQLIHIQAEEGKRLFRQTHADIQWSYLGYYLELSLLLIMCMMSIHLMGITKDSYDPLAGKSPLRIIP
ncbi:MCP four helix bundle domain-containing protein [Flavihumibacter petaseus]|uniref:Chemotaxis methyl-accepting receptor HlyB-like 4HB MCP domain-containing protein n=1 Tax=Flavihumibacter petaseus NBRC 106054 TaxID=1220578 RepID=A0A0E9MUV0_9BACT|nr:MCP four helix bundle domain-containing protein [Flavihumibacter petaseus]GAO41273.1 hypothetical protein FPE01S_01_02850 [Flavihumibacter petaseus NBRC 106054]